MDQSQKPEGKTTIAPEVLVSICQLATLGVDGVSHLTSVPKDVHSIFKKTGSEGVNITVEDNVVYADIYLIIKRDVIVTEVCHQVQSQVARAITEMVGMEIGRINIHVEDIAFN